MANESWPIGAKMLRDNRLAPMSVRRDGSCKFLKGLYCVEGSCTCSDKFRGMRSEHINIYS